MQHLGGADAVEHVDAEAGLEGLADLGGRGEPLVAFACVNDAWDQDKLVGIRWLPGRTGAPLLEESLAYFDCELTGGMRAGDHELVLGRIVDGKILDTRATPLTYGETGDMDGSNALYPGKF